MILSKLPFRIDFIPFNPMIPRTEFPLRAPKDRDFWLAEKKGRSDDVLRIEPVKDQPAGASGRRFRGK